ncbi:hypothetical protein ACNPON_10395 [Glutamicibacter sp. AGC13]
MSMRRASSMLLGLTLSMCLAFTFAPVASAHASSQEKNIEKNSVVIERESLKIVAVAAPQPVLLSTSGKTELNKPITTTDQQLAQPAIAPVIAWALRLVIQRGIPYAIKIAGRTALQKAFRQNLLAQNSNKWHHIFQAKHQWGKVGAHGNRSKTADLLSKAATKGKLHKSDKLSYEYRWVYKGNTIVAKVSKNTGQISDGWVK